jgi:RNAse (barnase) inhibitor barstar
MNALDACPPQAVLPLGPGALEGLRRAACDAALAMLEVDLHGVADRIGVMRRLAEGLRLPSHFGYNLDALYDCVTDLARGDAAMPGYVIVLVGIPETPGFDVQAREALLDVFRDAVEHFRMHRTTFRVFYSLAGDAAHAASPASGFRSRRT